MQILLTNPVWAALTTLQAQFAEGSRRARRFIPAITSLMAVEDEAPESFQDLADLLQPGEAGGVLLQDESAELRGLKLVMKVNAALMVQHKTVQREAVQRATPTSNSHSASHAGSYAGAHPDVRTASQTDPRPAKNSFAMLPLGLTHSPQMQALAALTKPGPFGPRTYELGNYFGIFDGDRLAAMAGERVHFPGFTEISAVCTHPDFAGRGYAAALVAAAAERIRRRGETPFLHVREDNTRAIRVYERLGFTLEKIRTIAVVKRAAGGI